MILIKYSHLHTMHVGAIARSSEYQQSTLEYFILSSNCSGDEISIFDCPYIFMQPEHMCHSDAGVICQGM